MCMEYSRRCICGMKEASFNFKDNVMPPSVISRLYCSSCSKDIAFKPAEMAVDNGWIIEYDMDVAKFATAGISEPIKQELTPDYIFDEGYATWRGMYPGDHLDSAREKQEIVKLSKTDPRAYLVKMKEWAIGRMQRLSAEGWRKANAD